MRCAARVATVVWPVLAETLKVVADPGERRVYVEFGKHGTNDVFFETPR